MQWAMIGIILIIFLVIPESPWWLASKGKVERASKVLRRCYGGVEGYNIEQQIVRDFRLQA
jgi:MFS transporter, SP family, general alpha glucoside:H+ symporter